MRESDNGYMVNGIVTKEEQRGGTAIIPNLDSIEEFRVLTNNADAEYGNFSGGQVNLVTKSGTNQFHGAAFDFLRNTDLDARNFFSPTRGSYIQNQFGGTLGGPIIHNKVFFFGDYQGTRLIQGASTGLVPVPSVEMRSGDFSSVASKLTGTVKGAYWANSLSQELGYQVTDGERYYTTGCFSSAQCVFPGAVIPQRAISPISQALLKYVPPTNLGAYFSSAAANQTLLDDKWSTRVDGNSGRFGMLSAYYHYDDSNIDIPYNGSRTIPFSEETLGATNS
jgi:hypothetical protein